MRIICLLLFIGLALSSSDYHDDLNDIYRIKFNTRYTVDKSRWDDGLLPGGHDYYFSLEANPNDQMYVECRVKYDAKINFRVDVCPFSHDPSVEEILTGCKSVCAGKLEYVKTNIDNFGVYTFPFSSGDNVKYITVHLKNFLSLDYLDVLIYSQIQEKKEEKEGMSVTLLVLIILLPALICAAIIIIILRHFCIATVKIDTGSVGPVTGDPHTPKVGADGKNYI
jgi:hypothetical protein